MIELKHVSYAYADETTNNLKDISLTAYDGEITLCTGVSGCGKSTLLRVINSLCPNYYGGSLEGEILIDGINVVGEELAYVSSLVGTLFQDLERQFFALNVEDEIAFALEWKGLNKAEIIQRVNDVIEMFSLGEIRNQAIDSLSEGQKQKVGLATVVAMQIKNIILDEPTANLDPESTEELAKILQRLKKENYCIMVVDHRLYYLKDYADKVYILEQGSVVEEGCFNVISNEVIKKYGLRKTSVTDRRQSLNRLQTTDDCIAYCQNLSFKYKNGKEIFHGLNLSFPLGFHVLLGRNGIGKTTLSRLVFGLEKPSSGKVIFKDDKVKHPLSYGSIVLQNTDYQLNMSSVHNELKSCFELSGQKYSKERIKELLKELSLENFEYRHPQSLSGGQKQRLVIGCALCKNPKILILDEPTSGLDGLNMRKIKQILLDYSKKGHCVVVITHDLELIDEDYIDAIEIKNQK